MSCGGGSSQPQTVSTMQRRLLQDANLKGGCAAERDQMFHVGYVDLPKMGRLSMVDIQEAADWCQKVLSLNPERSN